MTRDARGRAKFLAGIAVGCDEMQAKLDAYLAARKRWAKEQRDAKIQAQYVSPPPTHTPGQSDLSLLFVFAFTNYPAPCLRPT